MQLSNSKLNLSITHDAGLTLRSKAVRKRGVVTLEFILCLPVLVIVLLAAVQYGTAMIVKQAITHAANDGAREASKGASAADIAAQVQTILAPHHLLLTNGPGSGIRLVVEDGINAPQSFGDPTLTCNPTTAPPSAAEARVTICLNLTTAPLSNWLNTFGFDFTGRRFEVSSIVKKSF